MRRRGFNLGYVGYVGLSGSKQRLRNAKVGNRYQDCNVDFGTALR
jgi:hypothetical protein